MELTKVGKGLLTISGVGIITFLIGALIINSTLVEYSLTDFNLLKPRAISVGAVFIIYVSISLGIFMAAFGVEEFMSFSSDLFLRKNYFVMVFKIVYYTLLLTVLFFQIFDDSNSVGDPFYKARVFGKRFELENYIWIPFFQFFLSAFRFGYIASIRKKSLFLESLFVISYILGMIWLLVYAFTFFYNNTFNSVLGFEFLLCGLFLTCYTAIKLMRYFDKPKFHKDRPDIPIGNSTIFGYSLSLIILLYVILIVTLYSTSIYPKIGQVYGGGKLERMTFVTKNGVISGLKLHETDKYIFVINKDKNLSKINWDDIIQLRK